MNPRARSAMAGRLVVPLVAALVVAPGPNRAIRPPHGDFRATAVLERRAPGTLPRVRFEWSLRSDVVEYLLAGSWTAPDSWTVQGSEFRVTRRTATSWTGQVASFEVSLPPGDHSWRLAPVRRANGAPDFKAAEQVGFELR